ncbi:MAG: glycosyltransferase [Bacteroidetes bacterium]|jgi:glycosyltransferase involved in cell wall biosynthesis|nr:glycosyltransferase [Bacteroidota bacterium]MBT4397954.1 glycosyltransferase [Bacteroidota bacterium]MBT4408882.1 glycosyltransferase [Bacteroidota bacterium]MBT5427947.1 glycosyltransferase [Bacteroidota bacterium]MBT7094609.1 glycosyltransferase [Bacteroidota bacterium]
MNQEYPKVSIITVVYNAGALLEKTIANVLAQSYANIEYLIIDGASTDTTLEIIRKYEDKIDFWSSEPDTGLYDAMNKGIKAATGDYVWFINAGDTIYKTNTCENIFKPSHKWSDIYYGDTMIVDEAYQEIGLRRLRPPGQLTWKSFQKGMLVCHQSILVKLEIADLFDLKYKHSADFDWVIKALKKTKSIRNTQQVLSAFLDGGQSKHNIKTSLKERFDSMKNHYGLIISILHHIPIAFKFFWFYLRKGWF